tara:strand:+ start:786 stop:1277 length:492 start_codon:yes stop_codon:yes gene_type:complete
MAKKKSHADTYTSGDKSKFTTTFRIDYNKFIHLWARNVTSNGTWEDFLIDVWEENKMDNADTLAKSTESPGCLLWARWTKDTEGAPIQTLMAPRCYAKMNGIRNRLKGDLRRPQMVDGSRPNWHTASSNKKMDDEALLALFSLDKNGVITDQFTDSPKGFGPE